MYGFWKMADEHGEEKGEMIKLAFFTSAWPVVTKGTKGGLWEKLSDSQTDRQAGWQTTRQIDNQADRQTDKQTDRQAGWQAIRQADW